MLTYKNFPRPYLDTDDKFVDNYNKLIEVFPKKTIDLCVERINEQIQMIQLNNEKFKEELTNINNLD
jgi:hypothetical protein